MANTRMAVTRGSTSARLFSERRARIPRALSSVENFRIRRSFITRRPDLFCRRAVPEFSFSSGRSVAAAPPRPRVRARARPTAAVDFLVPPRSAVMIRAVFIGVKYATFTPSERAENGALTLSTRGNGARAEPDTTLKLAQCENPAVFALASADCLTLGETRFT